MYDAINSKYTYKNSSVLKNKLGIKDENLLKIQDTNIVLNITKENFRFSQYEYIQENMVSIIQKINLENLKSMSYNDMIETISDIMTDFNVLHPFREGNGRTIREFIRELLQELGYKIDFIKIDYNEIMNASKHAVIDDVEQIKLLKKYVKKIK